jgi:hypothetical protein
MINNKIISIRFVYILTIIINQVGFLELDQYQKKT